MSREKRYLLKEKEGKTFDHDENLPQLPLPTLTETLERYFESLKPHGLPVELEISRRIIDEFKNGVGPILHGIIEEKSWSEKNWINSWWEKYRFHIPRYPLYPYIAMALPLPLTCVNVPENEEYGLKAAARCIYHQIEFWEHLHRERIRPVTPPDGMKYFSMKVFRRFFCTARIPGEPCDTLNVHFKTASEGSCPTHGILIAEGRIFQFECVHADGTLTTPQEIFQVLQYVRGAVSSSASSCHVPVLTCDDRSSWAKNRRHLLELSVHNKRSLEIIESSIVTVCLDDHSPRDYSESSQLALSGDFHSKWADRSTIMVVYLNGKISLIGEPSAYDSRCSVSFAFFLLLSLLEAEEPKWTQVPYSIVSCPVEHIFDLDEQLRAEIRRVLNDCEARRYELIVSHDIFSGYGRTFITMQGIHWDSYIQIALLLTYYKMHHTFPSTNESILLRSYYGGRAENLRYLSMNILDQLTIVVSPSSTRTDIVDAFKRAAIIHTQARTCIKTGKGSDNHLFALYCASIEENLDAPELFTDPLFTKSGGNGKSTLCTSTSGFTAVNVFRAPMVKDGYGFFYSLMTNKIDFITTCWKESTETSAHKFATAFQLTLIDMKLILEHESASKL